MNFFHFFENMSILYHFEQILNLSMKQVLKGELVFLDLLAGKLKDIIEEGHDLCIVLTTFAVGKSNVALEDQVIAVRFSLNGNNNLTKSGIGFFIL